jgi:hypothetical protein
MMWLRFQLEFFQKKCPTPWSRAYPKTYWALRAYLSYRQSLWRVTQEALPPDSKYICTKSQPISASVRDFSEVFPLISLTPDIRVFYPIYHRLWPPTLPILANNSFNPYIVLLWTSTAQFIVHISNFSLSY